MCVVNSLIRLQSTCVLATLLTCGVAAAQSQSDPDLCVKSSQVKSSQVNCSDQTSDWVAHNRFVEVFGGQRQQDYQEADTQGLTPNGVLDTETGNQNHIGIALRWQTANHWLVHLQAQQQSGVTQYNGYLQAGNGVLTPYSARTGNTASQTSLAVGYALNAGNWPALSPAWQITPLLQWSQFDWQRNLVQYRETYTHSTIAAGVLLQWCVRPGTVLELQALQGSTSSAAVSAPSLGFAADQPGGTYSQWDIGISQALDQRSGFSALTGWHLVVRYSASVYDHAASPTVNALQAPPNQHRPNAWALGLRRQF